MIKPMWPILLALAGLMRVQARVEQYSSCMGTTYLIILDPVTGSELETACNAFGMTGAVLDYGSIDAAAADAQACNATQSFGYAPQLILAGFEGFGPYDLGCPLLDWINNATLVNLQETGGCLPGLGVCMAFVATSTTSTTVTSTATEPSIVLTTSSRTALVSDDVVVETVTLTTTSLVAATTTLTQSSTTTISVATSTSIAITTSTSTTSTSLTTTLTSSSLTTTTAVTTTTSVTTSSSTTTATTVTESATSTHIVPTTTDTTTTETTTTTTSTDITTVETSTDLTTVITTVLVLTSESTTETVTEVITQVVPFALPVPGTLTLPAQTTSSTSTSTQWQTLTTASYSVTVDVSLRVDTVWTTTTLTGTTETFTYTTTITQSSRQVPSSTPSSSPFSTDTTTTHCCKPTGCCPPYLLPFCPHHHHHDIDCKHNSNFVLLTERILHREAECACQQHGWALARIDDAAEAMQAAKIIGRCLRLSPQHNVTAWLGNEEQRKSHMCPAVVVQFDGSATIEDVPCHHDHHHHDDEDRHFVLCQRMMPPLAQKVRHDAMQVPPPSWPGLPQNPLYNLAGGRKPIGNPPPINNPYVNGSKHWTDRIGRNQKHASQWDLCATTSGNVIVSPNLVGYPDAVSACQSINAAYTLLDVTPDNFADLAVIMADCFSSQNTQVWVRSYNGLGIPQANGIPCGFLDLLTGYEGGDQLPAYMQFMANDMCASLGQPFACWTGGEVGTTSLGPVPSSVTATATSTLTDTTTATSTITVATVRITQTSTVTVTQTDTETTLTATYTASISVIT